MIVSQKRKDSGNSMQTHKKNQSQTPHVPRNRQENETRRATQYNDVILDVIRDLTQNYMCSFKNNRTKIVI